MEKKRKSKGWIAGIAGMVFAIPFLLILLAIVSLYLPPVQDYIILKCSEYVSQNTGCNLSVGKFRLRFPFSLSIHDYALTQEGDTLIGGESVRLNVHLPALLKGNVEVNYITIDGSRIDSRGLFDGVGVRGEIGNLRASVRSYDIKGNSITVNRLSLADSHAEIALSGKESDPDTIKTASANWFIALNNGQLDNVHVEIKDLKDTASYAVRIGDSRIENLDINLRDGRYSLEGLALADCSFRYDRGDVPDTLPSASHLHFDNINASFEETFYSLQKSHVKLNSLSFDQKPFGLSLTDAALIAEGDSNSYTISKLRAASRNGSSLKAETTLPREFRSGNIRGDLSLRLCRKDLQGFLAPDVYGRLNSMPDSTLELAASVRGTMRKLRIDTLYAQIPRLAKIGVSGEAGNVTESNRTLDLQINGSTDNLHKLLLPTALPDTFIAERLTVDGHLSLDSGRYSTDAELLSGSGRIGLKASYSQADERYSATARVKGFALSRLLPEIPLHDANLILTAVGKGLDIFSPETSYRYTLLVDTIAYGDRMFNSITLNAAQKNCVSDIHLLSAGKDMDMTMFAHTLLMDSAIDNRTEIEFRDFDLQRVAAIAQPARMSMKVGVTAATDLKENYSLGITGNGMKFVHGGKEYTPATLSLAATTANDSTQLHLVNGDLDVHGYMTAGYKAILGSVEKTAALIRKAIESGDTLIDIRRFEKMLPETSLSIKSKENNMVAGLLSLKGITYKQLDLSLDLDTLAGIESRASIYHFEREDMHFDTLRLALTQDAGRLKYFAGIRSRAMRGNKEKATFGAALYGALQGNELTANYIFRDRNDRPGMRIGVSARMSDGGFRFRFNPDAIFFRHPFTFNADNEIFIDSKEKITGNVELRDSAGSGVSLLAAMDSAGNRDVSLEVHNIDLETATRVLPFVPDFAGTVNADLHYRETGSGTLIGGDIHGDSIAYEGTLIGNESIELSYMPISSKEQHSDVMLFHNGNRVARLTGVYRSDSLDSQNIGELTITRLPVSVANAFLKKSNVTAKGYLDGAMTISREQERTVADGYVSFDSVYADMPQFGTSLHLVDDKVEVKESSLQFRDFSIYAKGSTPFVVNGTVNLGNLPDAVFDLRMKADNYEVINARKQKGAMFYGKMFVDLNSRIAGPVSSLRVSGNVTILGKTDITYILPETPLETANTLDGLVTFTDFSDTVHAKSAADAQYDFGDINMNLNLHIEEGARINADFDEERNSYIKLQGEGNLSLAYSRESNMSLTGRYTLSNGEMKYTLPIIPLKTFSIASGSSITWTGDIMNPILDITATERVTSSVTVDNSTQATAFDVGVRLTNSLDNMGLGFTLKAPENAAVQNQLNSVDAETLNKYALTMLITGVYTGGDNSLNVSNALGSYLDAQINNLVGDAMSRTMDINVGITDVENNSTGDKYKNYSFSFTKRFWNDRLTVIVGGEVNDGRHTTGNESFINNVSLEWKISNSGNRYLRLFYDKNYESVLEGEITEAGVGYIYKRKMNNLNELLIFRRKEKATPTPKDSPGK